MPSEQQIALAWRDFQIEMGEQQDKMRKALYYNRKGQLVGEALYAKNVKKMYAVWPKFLLWWMKWHA